MTTSNMELGFAMPAILLLLLTLPVWWWLRRRRRPPSIVFSRAAALARGPRAGRGIARSIFLLRNLMLVGVIVALARPRTGAGAEIISSEGINIAVVIDLSSSMLALDFQPQNRMEVAKETVARFVNGRQNDRIAVVSFAGEALTQVPLTTDHAVVAAAVRGLQIGQLEDGTAIGTAIATAANRLRDAPDGARVMILLTDGVNNRGTIDPRTAARAAAAYNVRIYAVGVGREGTAPVPVARGAFGLRYENQPVQIDEALLTEMAEMTGGRYYRAHDPAALQRIYEEIDRLERAPVQVRTFVRYAEQYRVPLFLALLSLGLELALLAWRAPIP